MKKIGIMAAIILINFVFQTSLYNFVDVFGVIPNISLIFVVIFAMMTNGIIGGAFGALTGILYDIMLYDVFGVYTLIYFIIGAVIGNFSDEMNRENYLLYCTITFISTIFKTLLLYVILFFLRYRIENAYYIIRSTAVEIILNTVITVLILKLVVYIFNRFNVK